jgi:hypothetical protein
LHKVKSIVKSKPLPPDPSPANLPTPDPIVIEPPRAAELVYKGLDTSDLEDVDLDAVMSEARSLTKGYVPPPAEYQPALNSMQLAEGAPREILTQKLADALEAVQIAKLKYAESSTGTNAQALASFLEITATLVAKVQANTSPEDVVREFDVRVLRPFCDGLIKGFAEEMQSATVDLRKSIDVTKHGVISDILKRAASNYGQSVKILYQTAISNSKDVVVKGSKSP